MPDLDQDGIPDGIDPNPGVYDKTAENKGQRVVDGKLVPNSSSSYTPDQYSENLDINPIVIFDGTGNAIPGLGSEGAKRWFTYMDTRPQYKDAYNTFKRNIAALGIKTDPKTLQSVWNDAVDWINTKGTTAKDPFDYLTVLNPAKYADTTQGPVYGAQKSTSSRVTQYSPSGAAQGISDTMEQELGRTANQNEITAYTSAVNEAAKKEPSTYTGVTTTSPGGKAFPRGISAEQGTQTTGFDPTMFARNFARSQPDFAESFAAKNVLKIIKNLIGDQTAIGQVVESGR
jgi:hypothetical protein